MFLQNVNQSKGRLAFYARTIYENGLCFVIYVRIRNFPLLRTSFAILAHLLKLAAYFDYEQVVNR